MTSDSIGAKPIQMACQLALNEQAQLLSLLTTGFDVLSAETITTIILSILHHHHENMRPCFKPSHQAWFAMQPNIKSRSMRQRAGSARHVGGAAFKRTRKVTEKIAKITSSEHDKD